MSLFFRKINRHLNSTIQLLAEFPIGPCFQTLFSVSRLHWIRWSDLVILRGVMMFIFASYNWKAWWAPWFKHYTVVELISPVMTWYNLLLRIKCSLVARVVITKDWNSTGLLKILIKQRSVRTKIRTEFRFPVGKMFCWLRFWFKFCNFVVVMNDLIFYQKLD